MPLALAENATSVCLRGAREGKEGGEKGVQRQGFSVSLNLPDPLTNF